MHFGGARILSHHRSEVAPRARVNGITVYRDTLSEGVSHFVTSMTARVLPAGAVAGWGLHPLESTAFSRLRQVPCQIASKYDPFSRPTVTRVPWEAIRGWPPK